MTSYITRCDDCTRCLGCGLRWCRAETVSPGESSHLCESCWATEDSEDVA